jgi:hypothetical protein
MVGQQDGAQLGELLRRVFERGEDDGAIVQGEREQLHVVG